jgi:hypothetical protein
MESFVILLQGNVGCIVDSELLPYRHNSLPQYFEEPRYYHFTCYKIIPVIRFLNDSGNFQLNSRGRIKKEDKEQYITKISDIDYVHNFYTKKEKNVFFGSFCFRIK